MNRSQLAWLPLVTVLMIGASLAAEAGNPNCPPPVLPGGIVPKNWSCKTGTQAVPGPSTQPTNPPSGSPSTGNQPQAPLRSIAQMMTSINRFWAEVFQRCGWPAYRPPRVHLLTPADIAAD